MALWTPAEITTELWLDAADASTVTEVSGAVSAWADKSGNGYIAGQTEATRRPVLAADGISFDGIDDFLETAAGTPTAFNAMTQFVIWKTNDKTKRQGVLTKRHPTNTGFPDFETPRFGIEESTANGSDRAQIQSWSDNNNTTLQSTTDTVDDVFYIDAITVNSASGFDWYRDGDGNGSTASANISSTGKSTDNRLFIGASRGDARFLDGTISEIVLCDYVIGTDDRQRMEGYLAWKWGLQSKLPIDNPYKNAAPEITTPSGEIGEGDLDVFAQKVAIIAEGDLDAFEQAVDLRIVAIGNLDTIAQSVNLVAIGDLDRIAQTVRDATTQEPPFDLELIIGDLTIPANQIHGSISITRSESSAALMNVTLIPPLGLQNITQYQGKPIILNYIESGKSTRLYTGKVDIPEVDIMMQTITLRCTDNRSEQNNALDPLFVRGIGCYSEAVFGEAKDQNDEIEKRLRTVQASLDYDANGIVTYTSWTPKTTADFVFDDASIYRRTPQVEVLSRGRVINKVNLDLTYRWVRLRHRERNWLWSYPFNANSWCGFLADNIGLCPVDAPRRAAEGAGWSIKPTTYITEPLPPSRWYRCTIGAVTNRPIGWQTSSRVCESRNKTDEDGNLVKDADGNQIVEQINCKVTDSQNAFTIRAEWTAAKRWAQTVEQRVNYVIEAPQSINQYGIVERDERVGIEFNYDAQSWESMTNYQSPQGVQSPNGDWIIDKNTGGLGEFNAAINCARAKAVADILGSHRQNYVTLQIPMRPDIDLRHTVETTAGKIRCKGKVYQIQHTIDVGDKFAETQIQIALSRADGSAATSLPSVNMPSTTDKPNTPSTIKMGTWVGGRGGVQLTGYEDTSQSGINLSDTTSAGLPKQAQGFITNYRLNRPSQLFTESFIVDTPAIEDASRNKLEVSGSQSATVAIRNDLLEVLFDE